MKVVAAAILAVLAVYAMTHLPQSVPEPVANWDDAIRAVALENVTARNAAQRVDNKYRECLGRKRTWDGAASRCRG